MNKIFFFPAFLFALVLFSGVAICRAEPSDTVRVYRPIMAKAVKIVVAGGVASDSKVGAALTSRGWSHFDAEEWNEATDTFLSALEKDATDHSAAEGLVMAIYRSGDYATGARLAAEIGTIMPGVKDILVRTVTAEVRHLIKAEKKEAADKLLAHFPADDVAYEEARVLVMGAKAIETALRSGSNETTKSASLAGN